MKKVCVVGNFSGRNAGDAAILGGVLHDLNQRYSDLQYIIPTINTGFVKRSYSEYNIRPAGMMPWNLSVKIAGLPILRSVMKSDLVLVTDAILFDLKLFNPLFNYLSTMALVLPMAARKGIPVVLYNVSLGPVTTKAGAWCMRRVIDSAREIIVRDPPSEKILDQVGRSDRNAVKGADCALNVIPSDAERVALIASERGFDSAKPYVTFNVNSYLDVFVRGERQAIDRADFCRRMGRVIDRTRSELSAATVMVCTQPMDLGIVDDVLSNVADRATVPLVTNRDYSYQDVAGVLGGASLHVGMRTHSLILASSSATPVIGIIATPKNRGYMMSIKQDERMMEFPRLTEDSMMKLIHDTWENRGEIRTELTGIVSAEKEKAAQSADLLKPFLMGSTDEQR